MTAPYLCKNLLRNYLTVRKSYIGVDFEIFPTNKIPLVKLLLTVLFASHQVLIAAASVASKPTRTIRSSCQSRVRGIKTGQATQLSDPKGSGSELASDAYLPSAPCIAFQEFATLRKLSLQLLLMLAEENSSSLVL